jgi:hypothetical protein
VEHFEISSRVALLNKRKTFSVLNPNGWLNNHW